MSQILRVIKPEMIQICRFYGGHRNLHNHYETLRIPPDASQKDIRQAFIKLSKEMHPDLSKTSNHMGFVKVSEAYQVLSKPHTRHQHDVELQYRKANNGRPNRVVYYDGPRMWYPPQGPLSQNPNDYGDSYYGIKGIRRVSNLKIALICIVISAVGLSLQVLAINKSMVFRRDLMLAESVKMQETYQKVRSEAVSTDEKEQILAFQQRLEMKDSNRGVKLQS